MKRHQAFQQHVHYILWKLFCHVHGGVSKYAPSKNKKKMFNGTASVHKLDISSEKSRKAVRLGIRFQFFGNIKLR